ncbi:hypothetical protein [Phyllobacterium ifriqiyense]|uniref:hypothetical protein n=1 Tax=Phyllobacterium ifriqiyense TaxID=314238 RepID=UPI0033920AC9
MGLFQRIFNPHDGSRRAVVVRVIEARKDVERTANRLEVGVADLLDENDRITGRKRHVQKPRS